MKYQGLECQGPEPDEIKTMKLTAFRSAELNL